MFSVGYKTPTTSSSAEEFKRFLRDFCYYIDQTVDGYVKEHRIMHTEYKRNGYGRFSSECPDRESISYGFSVLVSMLWTIADEITEAEERLEYADDEEGTEEHQHTMGELFGAKTMFLAILKRFPHLEKDRIKATGEGITQSNFLRTVAYGEGDTRRINTLDAGRISQGTISVKDLDASLIRFNDKYTPAMLTTNKTNAFKL